MPSTPAAPRSALLDFAFVALTLAHGVDDHLSAFELEALADRLYRHHPGWSQRDVQGVVQEALHAYALAPDRWAAAREACIRLGQSLDADARAQAIEDLTLVARADGVLEEGERQFVAKIAAFWKQEQAALPEGWTLVHDLTYLYLALAYGTDRELTDAEMGQIRHGVATGPLAPADADTLPAIVREALTFFARHPGAATRERVVARLGQALDEGQRGDVLGFLVQVANADGRFLDDEEDLLNAIAMEWGVDAGPMYSPE